MLVRSWLKVRRWFWNQVDQDSGWDGGCGGSQQETPRIGELLLFSEVDVSLATWNRAFLMPQWQRALRESWFLWALNCRHGSPGQMQRGHG